MVANTEARRSPTLGQLREWLTLIGAVVVVLGGLLGGVRLVVAPLHTEIQAMNGRLDRMNGRLDRMNGRLDRMNGRLDRMETEIRGGREELKAVRGDIAALSERLTRVEILLEQRGEVGPQEPPR